SCCLRSGLVLFVADLFHPLDDFTVELLLNGDVRHGGRGRGAMPMLLAGGKPDHVARPTLLDRFTPPLRPARSEHHNQSTPHAIRELEERFGVRLLARTTRSVAPTDAGAQLVARLRPALGDVREALELVSGLRDRPAGRVRLVVSPLAAPTVLAPKLGQFARDYPDVVLDVTTDEARVDLVAAGFDAGIHLGEFIQRDMIVIRVSQDLRPA